MAHVPRFSRGSDLQGSPSASEHYSAMHAFVNLHRSTCRSDLSRIGYVPKLSTSPTGALGCVDQDLPSVGSSIDTLSNCLPMSTRVFGPDHLTVNL